MLSWDVSTEAVVDHKSHHLHTQAAYEGMPRTDMEIENLQRSVEEYRRATAVAYDSIRTRWDSTDAGNGVIEAVDALFQSPSGTNVTAGPAVDLYPNFRMSEGPSTKISSEAIKQMQANAVTSHRIDDSDDGGILSRMRLELARDYDYLCSTTQPQLNH